MAHFARMASMALTPAEVNKRVTEMAAPVSASAENVERYPYGLCISLEDEQLDKARLDRDCDVGDTIHLCVIAKVTSKSERDTEGGSKCRVELQITDIGVDDDEDDDDERQERAPLTSERRARKRYGGEHEEKPGEGGEMRLKAADYEE